jgi:hypothetical protein
MVKNICLLFFSVFCVSISVSQTRGLTYQAIIYDPLYGNQTLPGNDNPLIPYKNKSICLKFEITDFNANVVYAETQTVTTNEFGMVNLIIGKGRYIGGTVASFDKIIWNSQIDGLIVSVDANSSCSNFMQISKESFTAVPFALGSTSAQSVSTGGVSLDPNNILVNGTDKLAYLNKATIKRVVGLNTGVGNPTATNPALPSAGDIYVNESTGIIFTYNGTSWINSSPSEVVGNEVTDVVANGGLIRTGSGTALDPYKLKINDGTTNGQLLTWDGTKWVAQAAPAEGDGVIGNELTDVVANGGLTRTGTGTALDPYKLKMNDGTTNGQLLTWDGAKWVAQAAPAEGDGIIGNELTDVVANGGLTRTGTGTAIDPYKLKINDGTTSGQILTWNGSKWEAQLSPVGIDGAVGNEVTDAVANGGLTRMGTGTNSDPYKLKINDGTTNGQLLTWDGTKWIPQAASVDWTLSGNSGTVPALHFIGTTDNVDFVTKTNNTEQMRVTSSGNIGIGTNSPVSKLDLKGPIATPLLAITANLTLDNTHAVVKVDATSNDVNITLPDPTTVNGRTYIIVKTDKSPNKLIFSQTIVGNEFTFTQANVPGAYQIQSNGVVWNLIK